MNASERQLREAWCRRPVFAGVLVGGSSVRMGQPKSVLRFEGTTFAERIVAVVRDRVERTVLLGGGPVPGVSGEIARLADVPGLAGPLAGMLAAMRWAREACWVFVACDLPLLRAEALKWLLAQREVGCWAVLPRVAAERVEPLLAVYEPESLELLERLVARGVRSPRHLAGQPGVCTPTPPAGLHVCWANVNTPEEYRRLARLLDDPPSHTGSASALV